MRLRAVLVVAVVGSTACHREPEYDGRKLSAWFAALKSNTSAERLHAAAIITRYAPDHPEAASAVIEALGAETDTTVHVALAAAVAAIANVGPEVIPPLRKLLADQHSSVRIAAIAALESIGHHEGGVEALAEVLPLTRDSDHDVRMMAARVVSRLVEDSTPSVAVVTGLERMTLTDPITSVRSEAASLLSGMRLPDSVAARVFPLALRGPEVSGQRAALRWLDSHGATPAELRARVTELTESVDPAVQSLARRVANRFGR